MNERIIFLDFDGVVVTRRTHFLDLDPVCMIPLRRIVEATSAFIVISSSWRIGRTVAEFNENLRRFGIIDRVIGMTPNTDLTRGREIELWLERNPTQSFVILDDDADIEPFMEHLVQTAIQDGLTEANADQAISILSS